MKKQSKKKTLKGKNKFIRLDEENLKFVVSESKRLDRSQNYYINHLITEERVRRNVSYSK